MVSYWFGTGDGGWRVCVSGLRVCCGTCGVVRCKAAVGTTDDDVLLERASIVAFTGASEAEIGCAGAFTGTVLRTPAGWGLGGLIGRACWYSASSWAAEDVNTRFDVRDLMELAALVRDVTEPERACLSGELRLTVCRLLGGAI